MSRSGYDDCISDQELNLWRGAVDRAIGGRRGQALLREMEAAIVALPGAALCTDALADDSGEVCAFGAVALARGLARGKARSELLSELANETDDDSLDPAELAGRFSIARAMAAEIVYVNDECGSRQETSRERHARVLAWVRQKVRPGDAT